jgi:hypothetical protein
MAKRRFKLQCNEATLLLSEAQERQLALGERTVLRMHTWVCSSCRNFGEQLGFIRQAVRSFADHNPGPGADGEPPSDT